MNPTQLHTFTFEKFASAELSEVSILKHSSGPIETAIKGYFDILPESISVNQAVFIFRNDQVIPVSVQTEASSLNISCQCGSSSKQLCMHQVQVLMNLARRDELRIFFDEKLRHQKLRTFAKEFGLEEEKRPDEHFQVISKDKGYEIRPLKEGLLSINSAKIRELKELLLPGKKAIEPESESQTTILILKKHRYYKQFQAELAQAAFAKNGKLKNPLIRRDPFSFIWKTVDPEALKFYTSISKFQKNYEEELNETDLETLEALVKNPLHLPVYFHDSSLGENLTSTSLVSVTLKNLPIDVHLQVDQKGDFYEIHSTLELNNRSYNLSELPLRFGNFILQDTTLNFIGNPNFLRVISWFKSQQNKITIHRSKFEEFRKEVLSGLEDHVRISYSYLKEATLEQMQEAKFDAAPERIIYLSDSQNTVWIAPVMKYGPVEVSVRSKKQIYSIDQEGKAFRVNRNGEAELTFLSAILRQHPYFEEQRGDDSFSLHKKRFLDENWFLHAFEEWRNQGISILGFNSLSKNKLNPNKVSISIKVMSGLDWFETHLNVYYGKAKVPLSQLQKSVRNKNRFVKLDDGTQGILPAEWLEKFTAWFQAGEVLDEVIRTPKINFSVISELYDQEMLSQEVTMELETYGLKLSDFESIRDVPVPQTLNATLRDYQKQGLNWLNFLDEFNFGGCLADDMGLGKTIQVLAFLLLQQEKNKQYTNLIVVPTTLISNWQSEAAKFAPSLKIRTIYGSDRLNDLAVLDEYDIILTSYGTLLNDVRFLKQYHFNYIILDESQTIKNPESMRYKAVCLLKSRNKLVLTGTPVENNTYDLYGQLSFACPGLLGNKTYFREIYAIPIDQFKDSDRAKELRKKVAPFILRRTKKQVATELPEKTEMVLYCEMEPAQREVYDTYKREYRDYLMSKKEDELSENSMHILKGITLLRQICNSPALLNEGPYYGDSSSKIKVLLEEIESKAPEHKILVFSQFVGMLDLIRKELQSRKIPFEYLTGQSTKRGEKVESFQSDARIRVFLISLKAGGTGLNLTEADYVYLVDPWWNPAVENQAIDRSYRIGQQKHVVAVRLICPNTIEEKMRIIQESKKELVNELIKTDSAAFKSLTKKDLEELFS